METTYHIEASGNKYTVIDSWQEEVGTFATEDAAKQEIDRCQKEDALYEDAQHLIDIAVKTLTERHGVDRQNAVHWIRSAAETTE